MYIWNWQAILLYKSVFIEGALVTLKLTLFVVVVGTILGIILAWLKQSQNKLVSFSATIFVELFRALPILVVLIWIFYVMPILLEWRISAFLSSGLALSFHLSGFVAETIRAGIESIPKNQFESGLALGMNTHQTMMHIVIPQATRNMIPNLMGLYINELKNTSLASIVAVNELLHRSNILISEIFRPLEIYTTVAVVYLIIIVPFILLARLMERHFSKTDKIILYETNY